MKKAITILLFYLASAPLMAPAANATVLAFGPGNEGFINRLAPCFQFGGQCAQEGVRSENLLIFEGADGNFFVIGPNGAFVPLSSLNGAFLSGEIVLPSQESVLSTPLPVALPLMATGMGGLFLIALKRRRKAVRQSV